METLYTTCASIKVWMVAHSNNFISGAIMALAAYFAPVRGIILVALAATTVDFLTGIISSRIQGQGIKSCKLWRSLYKIAFILIIIYLFYAIDKEMNIIELHRVAAWVIVGFEMWSILENMAKITDHRIFRILKKLMEDKVRDNTGIDVNEDLNDK